MNTLIVYASKYRCTEKCAELLSKAGVIFIYHTGKEHARNDRFYILPEYQNLELGSRVIKLVEELLTIGGV